MSDKDYKVVEKRVDELDLTLLIVVVPEAELEDKLAMLARESGSVPRNFYEDFIISVCVANINKLLHTFNQYVNLDTDFKMADVRRKVYDFVLESNKLFSPEFIYINKNGVLKVDKTGNTKLSSDEVRLVDNKMWNLDNYEAMLDNPPACKEDCVCTEEPCEEKEASEKKNRRPSTELIPVSNLKFEYVKKWWNRLSKYVEIKQFREEDAEHILRSGDFSSRSVFNSHIVSISVKNVRDLFEFLDSIGISSKVSPPILMHELYDLCRHVNPFLTFEEAVKWVDEFVAKDKPEDKRKKKAGLSMADYAKDSKQRKKFKDIPKKELLTLTNRINNQLIGQEEAIGNLVESIQRAGVGLRDPEKPIGSFLFAGSTGCGKTLTAKILAKELTRDKESLVIVDCSEYSADHEYAKLIGSPQGYVGFEQGGYLTNAVQKNPFSIVVFDEIEKASHKVHELLLQVLDEGRLTDGKGNQVSFKDSVVILTSNVGSKEVASIKNTVGFGDVAVITDKKKDIEIEKAIKKKFKPEFINRIDSIVYFKKLSKKDYMRIIDLELDRLNFYLKNSNSEYKDSILSFDSKIKNLVYREGINEEYGARPLKRCIEKMISTPLAIKMLRDDVNATSKIKVTADKNTVLFEINSMGAEPPFYLEVGLKEKEAGSGC